MMKLFTRPRETNFKLLQLIGTVFVWLAALILLIGAITIPLYLFWNGGFGVGRIMPLLIIKYVPFLLVVGHLLHWFVAMWETSQESNRALLAFREGSQDNKS